MCWNLLIWLYNLEIWVYNSQMWGWNPQFQDSWLYFCLENTRFGAPKCRTWGGGGGWRSPFWCQNQWIWGWKSSFGRLKPTIRIWKHHFWVENPDFEVRKPNFGAESLNSVGKVPICGWNQFESRGLRFGVEICKFGSIMCWFGLVIPELEAQNPNFVAPDCISPSKTPIPRPKMPN